MPFREQLPDIRLLQDLELRCVVRDVDPHIRAGLVVIVRRKLVERLGEAAAVYFGQTTRTYRRGELPNRVEVGMTWKLADRA